MWIRVDSILVDACVLQIRSQSIGSTRPPKVLDVLSYLLCGWLAPPLLSFTLYFVLPLYKKVVQQRFVAAANVALLVYYRILCPRRNDCPMIN